MATEIQSDLSSINDEDLLRHMWQHTEDFGRKKEIRAHMYKLREARLRDFYTTGDMDSTSFGRNKAPLTPSHGDSLADQSFQSFKTKEIRDSESPTHELKFTRGGVIVPDTSGWNVVTSSEVSPDGKAYKTEALASTEGVQKIPGGHSEFAGKNEHVTKVSHQGDDKNFVKKAGESSKTQLEEKTVTGDENSGRVETKSSSIVSTSNVTTSKQSSSGNDAIADHQNVVNDFNELIDSAKTSSSKKYHQEKHHSEHQTQHTSSTRQERQVKQHQHEEHNRELREQQIQNERYITDQANDQHYKNTNNAINQNDETINTTSRTVKHDARNIQQEVDLLAAQPGTIISRSVEYPDPNTKVVTETKSLPDGTTVTTRKFETKSASSKTWKTASNQENFSSSRSVVEDRAQRNRVEYTRDGKIVSEDISDTRSRNVENIGRKPEQVSDNYTTRNVRNEKVCDHSDQSFQQSLRSEEVHKTVQKNQTDRQDSIQSTDTVDRSTINRRQSDLTNKQITNRRESTQSTDTVDKAFVNQSKRVIDHTDNLKDQVENIVLDSTHQTVKKDLSQKVRSEKTINQDFIETENGCSMVDRSRPVPERYTSTPGKQPKHVPTESSTTSKVCREIEVVVDSNYPRQQPQKPDETYGYPSAPSKPSAGPQKPGIPTETSHSSTHVTKEFRETTHGFPSARPQEPNDKSSPQYHPSTGPQRHPATSPQKTTQITREYTETTEGYPSGKPSRPDDKFEPHGYPSTGTQKPTIPGSHTTTQTTTEYSETTHGYPSSRPQKPNEPGQQGYPSVVSQNKDTRESTSHVTNQVTKQQSTVTREVDHQDRKSTHIQDRDVYQPEPLYPSDTPSLRGYPSTGGRSPQKPERHTSETSRHVTKEFVESTHGYPSAGPQKPNEPYGYPSTEPRKPNIPESHVTTQVTKETRETSREYPSGRPQRPGDEPTSTRKPQTPSAPSHHTERTIHVTNEQRNVTRQTDTGDYPSGEPTRPTDVYTSKPQYPHDTSDSHRTTQTTVTREYQPQHPASKPQKPDDFVGTHGFPSVPVDRTKTTTEKYITTENRKTTETPDDFVGTHGYPSAPSNRQPKRPGDEQPYTRYIPDDASSVTTEQTDFRGSTESLRTLRSEHTRVDAAHEAFARSLRCVSPVDRGSVRSLRTSTSSIRSSSSPDKKGRRSPSRDSVTITESSRNNTSKINKLDTTIKKSQVKSPYDTKPTRSQPSKPNQRDTTTITRQRTNETVDLNRKRINEEEIRKRETKNKISNITDSRSPHTSPERPVKPGRESPDRKTVPSSRKEPLYDVPKSVRKIDNKTPQSSTPRPNKQPTTKATTDTKTTSKFSKTIKVDNAILRDDKTTRIQKRPGGKRPISEDEGFEPESPRSSSPTSSVSDLEYHKQIQETQDIIDEHDVEYIKSVKQKHSVNKKFIDKEQETFECTTDENLVPKKSSLKKTIEETYGKTERRTSPERVSPRYDSPERTSTRRESPDRRSPVSFRLPESTEYDHHEPFYLVDRQPEDNDEPKKPEEIKKPKSKPPLNRTETYEERCRKILGMENELIETTEDTVHRTKSPQRDTQDFITTERTVDERSQVRKRNEPTPSPRSTSPRKDYVSTSTKTIDTYATDSTKPRSASPSPTRRSKVPARETSPRRYDENISHVTTKKEIYESEDSTYIRSPHSSPTRPRGTPSDSPRQRSPTSSPIRKTSTQPRSPDLSPSRRGPSHTTSTKKTTSEIITQRKVSPTRPRTEKSPDRPSHITTAKISLSPTSPRKPSSPDTKKTPSKPQKSTNIRSSTTTREDTIRASKPATPRTDIYTTDKTRKTQNVVQQRRQTDKKITNLDYEIEQDSDVVSDNEDIVTIETTKTTKTTTKKVPTKKPVTERKESAPVYRSTKTERDQKMTRSTSDNILKSTISRRSKPDIETTFIGGPKTTTQPRKSSTEKSPGKTDRRPSKCTTTKTINLTATNNLINSEDMENVIIDIQQAKSSREPSPNRMVPTPVHFDVDTGKPRYPDAVLEPDDDTSRRPRVKNIPIFEEESNDFVGCHITEVDDIYEQTHKKRSSTTRLQEDESVVKTTKSKKSRETSPVKDRGPRSTQDNIDDECLLSVHDKVSKFITTAEDVKKPKPSAPFRRETRPDDYTETDECLLSVNAKVNKFSTETSKTSTKPKQGPRHVPRPNLDEIDEDLRSDECILSVSEKVNKFITTAEKLVGPSAQKSPELVAKIERQVSRHSDESDEEVVKKVEKTTTKTSITNRYTPQKPKTDEKPSKSKPIVLRSTEAVKKAKSVFENGGSTPKQRDILSRPSVWESKKKQDVKLTDIGVYKRYDEETDEVVRREKSPSPDVKTSKTRTTTSHLTDSVSTKKDLFENRISTERYTTTKSKPNDRTPTKPYSKRPGEYAPSKGSPRQPDDYSSTRYDDEYSSTTRRVSQPREQSPSRSPDTHRRPGEHSPSRVSNKYIDEYTTSTTKHVDKYSTSRPTSKDYSPSRNTKQHSPSPTRKEYSPSRYPDDDYTNRATSRYVEEYSKHSDHHCHSRHGSKETSPSRVMRHSDSPSRYVDHHTTERISTTKSGHPKDSTPRLTPKRPKDFGSSQLTDSVSSKRNIFEKPELDSPSSTGSRPSYMEHTVSSLEHIRRDSLEINKSYHRRLSEEDGSEPLDGIPKTGVKFGVELKRSDSREGRPRRKSSTSEIPHVEDIYDLELLERMLETVVGYEHRRRIRSQIRVVKKIIENQKTTNTTYSSVTKKLTDPTKKYTDRTVSKKPETYVSKKSETIVDRRVSPTRTSKHLSENVRSSSSQKIETESRHVTRTEEKIIRERSISPKSKVKTITTVTEIRKIGNEKPVVKKTVVTKERDLKNDKPIWATQKILKKASDNDRSTKTGLVKRNTTTKTQTEKQHRVIDDDCITSSYGIGPTDDDGRPLFGIRALKKKSQPSETTKVTGSVITEKFYSENGAPPVGERKVYVYSTNPDDVESYDRKLDHKGRLISRERTSKDGITSLTETRKIVGKRGDPDETEILEINDESSTAPPAINGDTTTTTTSDSKQMKLVRRGSVKEMSEKFTRKDSTSSITDKNHSSYPKAGLILRTKSQNDRTGGMSCRSNSIEYDDDYDVELQSTSSESSSSRKQSKTQTQITNDNNKSTRSFLNSSGTKVTGVNDVLDRMRNADNVIEDGDSVEDQEARALLNKFLGATVLMSGMESMVPRSMTTTTTRTIHETPSATEEVKRTRVTKTIKTGDSSSQVPNQTSDIEDICDVELLKQLLEKSTSYEERRQIRARLRQVMAERGGEVCTTQTTQTKNDGDAVVTTTTQVTTRTIAQGPKPMSPFAKFRQLDKEFAAQSPNSPLTPTTPMTPGGTTAPIFRFTDPGLNARAATFKEQLLQWCQMKTKDYENVQISNFSTAWSDGLAFCALIHHFLPDAFDYSKLSAQQRRENFELAFRVADEKAGIAPLLDVEDMVVMRRPDWKCVFTYVQTIYRRFRNSD